MYQGNITFKGDLQTKKISPSGPGLVWKIKNNLRPSQIRAWLGIKVAAPIGRMFGLMTAHGELKAMLFRADGTVVNYGVLSRRVVTSA